MTTQITKEANPRLPRPADYTPYSNRILASTGRRGPLPSRLLRVALILTILGAVALAIIFNP